MVSRVALPTVGPERRLAVIDMGSNTFRLVVFRYRPGGAFRLVDELRDTVRLSAGADERGVRGEAVERAAHTAHLYAAFCAAEHIDEVDAVTTSAARDAANRDAVLEALTAEGRLPVRVLSEAEEARFGYLGAVNSTTLTDGCVLDLGGGSIQATEVRGRAMGRTMSRPLGAVRMTEAFLGSRRPRRGELRSLEEHVRSDLRKVGWVDELGPRVVGIGGTVRTLARMAQKAGDYALDELHGYRLTREALGEQIERMAATDAEGRRDIPGLKADRADITLAGAVVIATALDLAGADGVEICSHGLREGVFYDRLLAHREDRLIDGVRAHTVLNLMDAYRADVDHHRRVADLALAVHDQLRELRLLPEWEGDRDILWAAAMLHDVGVAVDYNDHHRHGFYLVLNSGLPGYTHEEIALIALLVRGHRKAPPNAAPLEAVAGRRADERLADLGVCLRVAEQLAQSRSVTGVRLSDDGTTVTAAVEDMGDPTVAVWSAAREEPAMLRATGRRLRVVAGEG